MWGKIKLQIADGYFSYSCYCFDSFFAWDPTSKYAYDEINVYDHVTQAFFDRIG
jgi:hypothetical protein